MVITVDPEEALFIDRQPVLHGSTEKLYWIPLRETSKHTFWFLFN